MVNNLQQWDDFVAYLDSLIAIQHRTMEQTENDKIIYRAQGAIFQLRRLKLLRDAVLNQK
jgi:hypothetical protein